MGPIGVPELLIILVVALLVLGPKRLPEVGKSLGRGLREFKDGVSAADPFAEDEPQRRVAETASAPPPRPAGESAPAAPADERS